MQNYREVTEFQEDDGLSYIFKPVATKWAFIPTAAIPNPFSFLCKIILTSEASRNSSDDHIATSKRMSILSAL